MCLTAALVLVTLPRAIKRRTAAFLPRQASRLMAQAAPALALLAIVLVSLSRSAAVLMYYRAPMQVYQALPVVRPASWEHQPHAWMICKQCQVAAGCRL